MTKAVTQEGCMCFRCTGEGEALTYSNSTSENTKKKKKPNAKGGEDLNKRQIDGEQVNETAQHR